MSEIDITTTTSTEGGLLFQRDLEFPSKTISTPIKTIPVEYLTSEHRIQEGVRNIAEVHKRIDASDLEAYRSGTPPQSLVELQEDLKYSIEDELVVVFLEYTDAQEIDQESMRTILDIQDEIADILTMPFMPPITDALSPLVDSDVRFERSPWRPYYNSVRRFLENVVDYNKPVMGVLPSIGVDRRQEILREYEASGIQLYAVDFAGLKPTTDDCYNEFQSLIADISKRFMNDARVLYAVNYKRYHPTRNTDLYPSEAFALISEGIDIAGGTHIHRLGGGGDGEVTDTKIFNPNELGFDAVPFEGIEQHWDYQSSIGPEQFIGVSDGKQRELRKLVNAELMSFGLNKLRAAIQHGHERSFLEGKSGYQGQVSSLAEEMVKTYENARGPDIA